VFHGPGEPLSESCELPEPADRERGGIRTIMSNHVVCARGDLDIHAAIQLMMRHHIGCLPIVDHRRRPIGIITKLDLVEQLETVLRRDGRPPSDLRHLRPRTVEDVMMPLALTLQERATVAQAATMMAVEDTHHVLVVSEDNHLVGVVSTRDVVMWVVERELASARAVP